MKVLMSFLAVALSAISMSAFACEQPGIPEFPTGRNVSERDKGRLDEAVVQYTADMTVYVTCLQEEHSAAESAGAGNMFLSLIATRNNNAIAELKAIHEAYTKQFGPVESLFQEPPAAE